MCDCQGLLRRRWPTPSILGLCAWVAVLLLAAGPPALAGQDEGEAPAPAKEERWNWWGQATSLTQYHGSIRSPYEGGNSLQASETMKGTHDLTLYLGWRPWSGGELYVNPEVDQGFGLSNTLGLAGFSSGEAYKVGQWTPYLKLPRLFLRQTFALDGGEREAVEAGPNQLAGSRSNANLTLTVGKFSVVDIFDTNVYAHDPRNDFINWAILDAGAFDYAADSWGFTEGAALEWTRADWSLRGGFFALSKQPNSEYIDEGFGQHSWVAEVEHRLSWDGHAGKLRLLAFLNQGRMARYDDALALAQSQSMTPELAPARRPGNKSGYSLNLEQELSEAVGLFVRFSTSDGSHEAFDFTEINRSLSGGLALKGSMWGLPMHSAGLALAVNDISAQARRYLAAGGLGILIGDGQLPHYGSEQAIEAFYSVRMLKEISATLDLQHIANPAYNRDRGPVSIIGVRVHCDF